MTRTAFRSLAGMAGERLLLVRQGNVLSISVNGDQVLLRLIDLCSSVLIGPPTLVWQWP